MRRTHRHRRWGASFRHGAGRFLVLALLLAAGIEGAQGQEGPRQLGSVTGRILDSSDGEAVPGVEVRLGPDRLAVTDERGEFHFRGIAAGVHVLRAQHVAYRTRSDSLVVPDAALVEVTITLSSEPIQLAEMRVEVRSPVLARSGFYERQEQGYGGSFIDRREIERRDPASVTDLFRNVPGLRVIYGGIYGSRVFVNQRATFRDSGRPGCDPSLWLDGVRATMPSYDLMRVEEIEGVEVYTGGNAPDKFNDICGTVVIWTRVPVR